MIETLEKAGLTNAEAKIYLALIKKGPLTKTPLVKHSQTSSSKIYEVTDKLLNKGLISITTKKGIKHFEATSPKKINEYLKEKKKKIEEAEQKITNILPKLEKLKQESTTPEIHTYEGWESLATIYQEETEKTNKGKEIYIIGASTGKNKEKTENFFKKNTKKGKHLKVNVIFNKTARKYAETIEKQTGIAYNKKYLYNKTPTEITIINNTTIITILQEKPTIITIKNKETAESFKQYFKTLWKTAKG